MSVRDGHWVIEVEVVNENWTQEQTKLDKSDRTIDKLPPHRKSLLTVIPIKNPPTNLTIDDLLPWADRLHELCHA
jgi:hypothetical protein